VSTPRGVLAVAAFLTVGCATRPASTEEWVSILSGTWGWVQGENTCETNPHEITFSPDRRWMYLKTTHPILTPKGIRESEFQYQILSVTPSAIRMQLEDETRLTDSGKPVIWDLQLLTQNQYRWHRTDWRYGAYTRPVKRCG
jgi:hypothetical protein